MKILHTSDWHLGRSLYGRKRYDEFACFLDWLALLILTENIDALFICGDVFDTSTPSNRSQELYYKFLCRIYSSKCRHVVIIAGNHDSPSFLNAPKELLSAMNVHVVGSITEDPGDEVLVLKGQSNTPEAIVCAVPYLRDRDIRISQAGESVEDKNTKLIKGLKAHYANVCSIAQEKQKKLGPIPIIGMGHLFTAGGKTVHDDGVRELYVGSLAHVGKDVFPECLNYVALGHLHVPQKVGHEEHIRYSGSPLPMGFGEARQKKKVMIAQFSGISPQISEYHVPCFQPLEKITGTINEITERLYELKSQESCAWLEIEYTGSRIAGNLRELVDNAISGTDMEIRRIKNQRLVEKILNRINEEETLDDLDVNDVFNRCLDAYKVEEPQRPELMLSYNEIIQSLLEEDINAE